MVRFQRSHRRPSTIVISTSMINFVVLPSLFLVHYYNHRLVGKESETTNPRIHPSIHPTKYLYTSTNNDRIRSLWLLPFDCRTLLMFCAAALLAAFILCLDFMIVFGAIAAALPRQMTPSAYTHTHTHTCTHRDVTFQ